MTELYHHGICRICLSVGTDKMHSLCEQPEILQKLQTCFSLNIIIEDFFPCDICIECKDKLEDIHSYYQKIRCNESLLTHYAQNRNELNNFYLKLKDSNIKTENDKFGIVQIKNERENFILEHRESKINCLNNLNVSNDIKPTEITDNHVEKTVEINDDCSSADTLETNQLLEDNDNERSLREEKLKNYIVSNEKINNSNFVNNSNIDKFKCLSCFEVLNTKSLLLNHYNSIHKPKETSLKIDYEMFSTNGADSYKCCVCFKHFQSKKAVTRHSRAHADGRSFLCKLCGRTYRTASEIVRHGRAHDGSRVYCSHNCGYSTAYLGALIQHEKRHDGDHKYKCEECGKGFQVKTWYLQHQNVHKGLKPFVCNICGVAFHMDRYLTAHKSSVHPQTSDVKRYVCPHCSRPCDSRKAFTEHLKEHGIRTSYLCDLCGKSVSNAEQLKFHKRMHLGVKPYSCSTCDKSFAKKFNLQLHLRSHSGDKAHACASCPRRYTQRSALLRHKHKHHSDTNQHKCLKCNKILNSPSQLASHQKLCM